MESNYRTFALFFAFSSISASLKLRVPNTACSKPSFLDALWNISDSKDRRVINRYMVTFFDCPIRWQRALNDESTHSYDYYYCSYNSSLSNLILVPWLEYRFEGSNHCQKWWQCRLRSGWYPPLLPSWTGERQSYSDPCDTFMKYANANQCSTGRTKKTIVKCLSIAFCRSLPETLPSKRSHGYFRISQYSSIISIIFTIWEKINTCRMTKIEKNKLFSFYQVIGHLEIHTT